MYVCVGVVFGYKAVLLLFGVLLVYETRSIKRHQINDSRLVSMAMCNIVVSVCVCACVCVCVAIPAKTEVNVRDVGFLRG